MVKTSRLTIVVLGILVPVVILLYFIFYDFKVEWFTYQPLKDILLTWIAPILFCGSWVYIIIILGTRFAATMDIMDETSSVIPIRFKFFYGLNAIFILLLYILPLITPIISAFAFMSMMFRVITARKDWDLEEKTSIWIKIFTFIAAIPSIFVSILVIPEILSLADFLWTHYWIPNMQYLYDFSMAFATALTFGALILLIKTGISEVEQGSFVEEDRILIQKVYVFDVIMTAFLVMLRIVYPEFLQVFYWAGFIFVIIIWIINTVKGKSQNKDFKSYFFGYLLTIIFLFANVLIVIQQTNPVITQFLKPLIDILPAPEDLRNIIMIISGVSYIIIYLLIFFGHPDLEDED